MIEIVDGVEVEVTKHFAGVVGVDSGQALLCDPCYIESQWKGNELSPEFTERKVRDTETGNVYAWPTDFGSYEWLFNGHEAFHPAPCSCGLDVCEDHLTVNKLVESGRFEIVSDIKKPSGEFSYEGCCRATVGLQSFGQLRYGQGHDDAGVAFSTGCGDGVYPVYVYKADVPGWGNRVVKVEICFFEEEEGDE